MLILVNNSEETANIIYAELKFFRNFIHHFKTAIMLTDRTALVLLFLSNKIVLA